MEENREILQSFEAYNAVKQVQADALSKAIVDFANNAMLRENYGVAARRTMAENQGAIEVVLEKIAPLID